MRLYRTGLAAAAVAALALTITACSSSSSGGSSNPPSSETSSQSAQCATGTLSADGSSAQANAMTAWVTAYQKACSGATVNYTSTNSGQGVSDFVAGKIGFGGSDAALDPKKGEPAAATAACGSTALDLPMVVGPIAIAYNVSGVGDLTLTPDVLAKIFLGKITSWNDSQITAINSGTTLPSIAIKVFFRGDPSGTSKNFENYLSKTAGSVFTYTPDKPWPGKTGSGVQGSPAVASAVKSTAGAIGYMEWSYAGSAALKVAKIDNGGGAVTLNGQSAGTTVGTAKIVGAGDDLSLSIDYATKTPGAYPIVLVTYELVCTKYKSATQGAQVKSFLTYTSSQAAQNLLPSQGYAPLPASILSKVQAVLAKIA